jgi:HD superfamily phosphodiesterase
MKINQWEEFLQEGLDQMKPRGGFAFADGAFDERIHAHGVAYFCVILARKRGLNTKLAYCMGLLHDWGRIYGEDFTSTHGKTGADLIKDQLKAWGDFTDTEQAMLLDAFRSHSKKKRVDGPYAEVLKDADLFERVFSLEDLRYGSHPKKEERLLNVLESFGLARRE